MFRGFIGLVIIGLLVANCGVKESASQLGTFNNPEHFLGTVESDTIPKVEPVPLIRKSVDLDSVALPQQVVVRQSLQTTEILDNVYDFTIDKITEISNPLKVVSPGKDGIPIPNRVSFHVDTVPVKQPIPTFALLPRAKDEATYDIKYLDVDQGLVSSYVRCALLDQFGNMWIATSYGVSRYDGNSFMNYTTQEGLIDNRVMSMLRDSKQRIWFGTSKGFCVYNGKQFLHYKLDGLDSIFVRYIYEDSRKDIWIGTRDKGLIKFDQNSFLCYGQDHGLTNKTILCVLEDRHNDLWVGTDGGGLIQINQDLENISFSHYTIPTGTASNIIFSLFEDDLGNIWLATRNGIKLFDGDSFVHYSIAIEELNNTDFTSILKDKKGHFWFGTHKGLFHFKPGSFPTKVTYYTEKEGLTSQRVRSLLEDDHGNIWLGTGGGGMNRLNNNSFIHFTKKEGIIDEGILSIEQDRHGNLWLGSSSGLSCFNPQKNINIHYTNAEGLPHNEVRSILEDHEGSIWLATPAGLSCLKLSKNQDTFTNYTISQGLVDNDIRTIFEDKHRNIWLGTSNGLTKLSKKNNQINFTNYPTKEGLIIRGITEDQRGGIWFASNYGASHYRDNQLTHFTITEGLINDDVHSILKDNNGELWFGTPSGISRFNLEEGRSYNYTTEAGINNNFIWALIEDRQGNIWASTERGLNLLKHFSSDSIDQDYYQFFSFDKSDGLKRLDFHLNSVVLDHNNSVWWGAEGLTQLDLNEFKHATEPPKSLSFSQIDINQQVIDYQRLSDDTYQNSISFGKRLSQAFDTVVPFYNYPNRLELPSHMNHLTFHFSAIDWAGPHKIKYQYYLEGIEKRWNPPSHEPIADYRNISSGSYTFKVRAIGEAQKWSEVLEYPIIIHPPWWFTWWALFGYALSLAGIVYIIIRYFKRRLLLENELKRKEEESKRLIELDRFKNRLYTNLTHEFRTPLTVILGMADEIQEKPHLVLEKGVNLIRRNGLELLQRVNQLLDLSKLENKSFKLTLQKADIVHYLQYITESFHTFANSKNLSLKFLTLVEDLEMDFDPEQIKQVMTNLISNAIKFTPPGGLIMVRLKQVQHQLEIEIEDTGIGIAPEYHAHIFDRFYQVDSSSTRKEQGTGIGLSHSRELVELMGGKILVESKLHIGTKMTVVLPVTKRAHASNQIQKEVTPERRNSIITSKSQASKPKNQLNQALKGKDSLPRLLIIEDNTDVVLYLKSCLSNNYELDVALNGKIGIEKALDNIPDIIISDVMMPEKDGFEVCTTLKSEELTSHIPIILLTAKADQESRINGLKSGADVYLEKPFDKEELLVRLKMMLVKQENLAVYFSKKLQQKEFFTTPLNQNAAKENSIEDEFLERVRLAVEANYRDEDFGLPQLCHKVGMSRSQLYRKLKALTNMSPTGFIRKFRLEAAKTLLETTNMTVSEIAWETGFKSLTHFSKSFNIEFGHPPSATNK